MNIDWSKAPEGATHKDPETDCFYKLVKDVWHLIYAEGESCVSASLYNGEKKPSALIERPKKQEAWDGDGLPPVNCFCEALDDYADCWVKVEIYAHTEFKGDTYACAKNETDMFYGLAHEFRSIKTAEQVAAEERDKAIEEMVFGVCGCEPDGGNTSAFMVCGFLYDAGYRKQ